MRADGGGAARGHLQRILRIGKTLQAALAQRVETDNARATFGCRTQLAQHARMVGAGVLTKDEDGVGHFKVCQSHRALAYADGGFERHAAGLVAHVGAVGEVVGTKLAHKELVQKRRLVAGAARGVEQGLVRVIERVQLLRDQGKGGLPFNRFVAVACLVVDQRMRQTSLFFQFKVRRLGPITHRARGDHLGCGPFGRRLRSHGLDPVFAEFKGRGVVPVRPSATRAIKTIGLVGCEQGARALGGNALAYELLGHTFERAPASCRMRVDLDFLLGHGRYLFKDE